MEIATFGVVLGFADYVEQIAVALSRVAAGHGETRFTLDRLRTLPHCTIYQARFPESALPEIRERFAHFVPAAASLTFSKLAAFEPEPTLLFWDASPDDARRLEPFQREVIAALAPLRHRDESVAATQNISLPIGMSAAEAATGYPLVDEAFRPHVTITRFVRGQDGLAFAEKSGIVEVSAKSNRLMLVRCGPKGEVAEVLSSHPLT